MGLFGNNKKCEFCNDKKATRKVEVNGEWKLICEKCWKENKITPYQIIF